MHIKVDELVDPRVHALLQEHMDDMVATSPPESIHALDLAGLRKPEITFWTMWDADSLVGCGALKALDSTSGEIKSMRTARAHLRKGIARKMLDHIIAEAKRRGYGKLLLETGPMPYFEPARRLYADAGFEYCRPFGSYREDPNSVFMVLALT